MPEWLLLLASVGLLYIVMYGEIFAVPREYIKSLSVFLFSLFSCSMCLGFWTGVFTSMVNSYWFWGKVDLIYCFLFGCAVSFVGNFFDYLIDLIGTKANENTNENNLPHNK